ncbi:hypothetical protein MNBD_BACTEROID02-974, partial [hydrothermal vent metagenome]
MNRRKFSQILPVTVGGVLVSSTVFGNIIKEFSK